jgi:hypothetical protein
MQMTGETPEQALAIIQGGLGKAELEVIGSMTAPIFWVLRNSETGLEQTSNGTIFFVDTGQAVFGVTAAHVVTACFEDTKKPTFVQCMVGRENQIAFPISIGDRVIDAHPDIDIATLRFTAEEIQHIGRTVVRGYSKNWPPPLVEAGYPVTYCGFPGRGRTWLAPRHVSFGCVPMAGMVTNAHETCTSIQIDREKLERVLGDEDMPENFDFGGMSGGPMLLMVQRPNLFRSWIPAAVIIQGPNTSDDTEQAIAGREIIRARPLHFVNADGSLNVRRWDESNFR